MGFYNVTIERTEVICFRVEAASENDALDTYWDGDETGSETSHTTVLSVEADESADVN